MRKTLLALSALAAVAITASSASRSEASPLVNPTALSGAIDEIGVVDSVHCRPGWRHHNPRNWRRADGCARRGAVIVAPGSTRYVWRDGVRVRVGDRGARSAIRSGDHTTIRSRTDVNVRTGGDTRRGGATQGRGGATQERGSSTMQDRGGGAQKGGGAVQKGGGGMQKDGGGGAQKGGQGQTPQ